ncbi:hypothetical protein ABIA38_001055 [Embleya sp. AB8]
MSHRTTPIGPLPPPRRFDGDVRTRIRPDHTRRNGEFLRLLPSHLRAIVGTKAIPMPISSARSRFRRPFPLFSPILVPVCRSRSRARFPNPSRLIIFVRRTAAPCRLPRITSNRATKALILPTQIRDGFPMNNKSVANFDHYAPVSPMPQTPRDSTTSPRSTRSPPIDITSPCASRHASHHTNPAGRTLSRDRPGKFHQAGTDSPEPNTTNPLHARHLIARMNQSTRERPFRTTTRHLLTSHIPRLSRQAGRARQ